MQEEMDVQAREEREAAERHAEAMRLPFWCSQCQQAVCRERTERERAMAEEAERLMRLSLHVRHRQAQAF